MKIKKIRFFSAIIFTFRAMLNWRAITVLIFLNSIVSVFSARANEKDSLLMSIESVSGDELSKPLKLLLRGASNVHELDSLVEQVNRLTQIKTTADKAITAIEIGLSYFNNFREDERSKAYFIEGLKLAQKVNDSMQLTAGNYALASLHYWREEFEKALHYAKLANNYFPSNGSLYKRGHTYTSIGASYENINKNYSKAIHFHKKALASYKKSNHYKFATIALNNISSILMKEENYDNALIYIERSIFIADSLGFEEGKAHSLFLKGKAYYGLRQFKKATSELEKAVVWWEENNFNKDLPKAYKSLYKGYQKIEDFQKASETQDKLLEINERLYEERKIASLEEMQTKYETEQKELEIAKQQKEVELANQEKETLATEKKYQRFIFIVVALLLVVNTIYFFYRYKQQKRDKEIITSQKEALEKKNKEILDSITYAKRLQDAILPSEKLIKSFLVDSFIFYKPKDIVAGDFYYMDVVEENDRRLIYYVAADCTGHGVPGAMVSIVGANGLKRCIQEFGLRKPGEILDKLAELVATNFAQSEERIRDGMDLALCCLEFLDDKINKVYYAGANNPLWVINPNRKKIPDYAVPFKEGGGFEIKANKQAIGYTEKIKPFTSHELIPEKGDVLYTFSDGYPDQFGGEKPPNGKRGGKKLKSSNFRKILFELYGENMET